ncbi:MAG: DUF6356 family protein [Flavobacteriaceae bacterium]
MKNAFTRHPHSVGENYWQHFGFAVVTGLKLIGWGCIAIIHGIFPFAFTTFVSDRIRRLYHNITARQPH